MGGWEGWGGGRGVWTKSLGGVEGGAVEEEVLLNAAGWRLDTGGAAGRAAG